MCDYIKEGEQAYIERCDLEKEAKEALEHDKLVIKRKITVDLLIPISY